MNGFTFSNLETVCAQFCKCLLYPEPEFYFSGVPVDVQDKSYVCTYFC